MYRIKQYWRSENGATALEYALIASGISFAIMVAVFAFGEQMAALYESLLAMF